MPSLDSLVLQQVSESCNSHEGLTNLEGISSPLESSFGGDNDLQVPVLPVYDGFDLLMRNIFQLYMKTESKCKHTLSVEDHAHYIRVINDTENHDLDPQSNTREQMKVIYRKRAHIRLKYVLDGNRLFYVSTSGKRKSVATHANSFDIIAKFHGTEHHKKGKVQQMVSSGVHGITNADVSKLIEMCIVCNPPEEDEDDDSVFETAITKTEGPFERLQIDIVDVSFQSSKGECFLSIRDHFSNYGHVYPMTEKRSLDMAKCLGIFVGYYGCPTTIQHDSGYLVDAAIAIFIRNRGIEIIVRKERSLDTKQNAGFYRQSIGLKFDKWRETHKKMSWHLSAEPIEQSLNNEHSEFLHGLSPLQVVYGPERAKRIEMIQEGMPDLDVPLEIPYSTQPVGDDDLSNCSDPLPTDVAEILQRMPQEAEGTPEPYPTAEELRKRSENSMHMIEETIQQQSVCPTTMVRQYAKRRQYHEFKVGEYCLVKVKRNQRSDISDQRVFGRVTEVNHINPKLCRVQTEWGVIDELVSMRNLKQAPFEMRGSIDAILADAPPGHITMKLVEMNSSSSKWIEVASDCENECMTNKRPCHRPVLEYTPE